MKTLQEELAELEMLVRGRSVETPTSPTLFAVPIPNGPGGGDCCSWPSLAIKRTLTFSISADGGIICSKLDSRNDPTHRGFTMHQHAVCRASRDETQTWFVLLPITEGQQDSCGWKSWTAIAKEISAKLWMHPGAGVADQTKPTAAALAYVFRSVLETDFVSRQDGFLAIRNLWGATLFALSPRNAGIHDPQSPNPAINPQAALWDAANQTVTTVAAAADDTPQRRESDLVSRRFWHNLASQGQTILRCLWQQPNQHVDFAALRKLDGAFKDGSSDDSIEKAIRRIVTATELTIQVSRRKGRGTVRLVVDEAE